MAELILKHRSENPCNSGNVAYASFSDHESGTEADIDIDRESRNASPFLFFKKNAYVIGICACFGGVLGGVASIVLHPNSRQVAAPVELIKSTATPESNQASLTDTVNQEKDSIENASKLIGELSLSINSIKDEKLKLEQLLTSKFNDEKNKLLGQIYALEQNIQVANNAREHEKNEYILRSKAEIDSANAEVSRLNDELSKKQDDIDKLIVINNEKEVSIAKYASDRDESAQEVIALNNEINELRKQVIDLNTKLVSGSRKHYTERAEQPVAINHSPKKIIEPSKPKINNSPIRSKNALDGLQVIGASSDSIVAIKGGSPINIKVGATWNGIKFNSIDAEKGVVHTSEGIIRIAQ